MPTRRRRASRAIVASLLALASFSLAATAQTPATSLTNGLPFRTIGPAAMSGRFVDLAVVEATPHVFYAASSTGGLWKTTNNGTTFTALFNNEGTHSLGAVAVHQRDTAIVWLGTGERANRQSSSWGDGVYLSRDGGRNWRNVGLRNSAHIGRIVLHPQRTDVAYVAAMGQLWGPNEERGLYRTRDGGATWQRILHVDQHTGVVDVAMDPSDPNILYAASYQRRRTSFGFDGGGPGSALWKSTDGGETWRKLSNGLPSGDYGRIGIAIFRGDPRIVYVSIEQGLRYTASTAYEEPQAGLYRSDDRGETWTHQSTWNPRPMYASQVIVDPVDPCRIYMMNFFSTSTDCGKTSRSLRQSLHGDDRAMWINPANPMHLIKADDGGIGISYDRAESWLFIADLPVSQFYRVSFDMQKPYNVYGGLQDNGSWAGPSATYRSEGITNADWIKWGGGDGFFNVVDTSDNRTLYTASQFLGLSRVNLATGEERGLRPGDPTGAISARRNWTTWGDRNARPQRLGNAMAPANWDAPILLSSHDTRTLYAGTNILWKSSDRGDTWIALGDRTKGIDRRTLPIMGRMPTAETRSLDDGVPYWPSVSAIAESPRRRGVLWVGTDDGNVQRSGDDGRSWTEMAGRMPGLPRGSVINGIEVSRHVDARVYVVANDYRNGDFGNYVYRSDDDGGTWTRIDGGLPAARVVRTLREDLVNPDVLFLGTELGLFWSNDRGATWAELRGGMPLMAHNDLFIHPREHDLVLGTHSRGIWILDHVSALRELTPAVAQRPLHVFSTRPAEQIRYRGALGHVGDVFYTGDNPPAGGIIDIWLRAADSMTVSFHDASGAEVARQRRAGVAGVNRVVWDLRYAGGGPLVHLGTYEVRVAAGGATATGRLEVREDPRITVAADVRRAWTESLRSLATLRDQARALNQRAQRELQALPANAPRARRAAAEELVRESTELASRVQRLYGDAGREVGPLTAIQREQEAYYRRMLGELGGGR
ncbi:MAG: hypothetical protein KF689_00725 [Gemmatimonadaceae bacterium]|nr:hypothetical protein [Gemmatimonadaceae bacterium]MCW5826452.1 hypothetical protein [Gemmatimonadaceae bacterium]